ncbi:MAG: LamG domain-containing protein [Nitrospiraceae bacterium]|nr:MAG: LamG domain-containing protein [Nitrospiraceae bacterium]
MSQIKCAYKNLLESGTVTLPLGSEDSSYPAYRLHDRDIGKKFSLANGLNHGQSYGATTDISGGKIGRYGYFDGGDYINIPHNARLNIINKFTLAFWARREAVGAAALFEKGNDSNGWDLNGDSSGNVNLRSKGFNSSSDHVVSSYLPDSVWTFCVITYDVTAGANNLKFYRNGSSVATFTETGGLLVNSTSLKIGRSLEGTQFFTGLLDEVTIWGRALSGAEITDLYNSGNGENLTGDFFIDLCGYWKFDEAAWSGVAGEVKDSSVKQTINIKIDRAFFNPCGQAYGGAQTIPGGKLGRCGSFDGVNDYVNITHNDKLNITQKFSMVFWAKLTSGGTTAIFEKGNTSNGWDLAGGSGGDMNLRSSGFISPDHVVSGYLTAGAWTFCVITYDASAGADNLKFYKNGSIFATFTETGGLIANATDLKIGTAASGGQFFKGLLDEVAIYSRVLSGTEITELHNGGDGKILTGAYLNDLAGYWKFDEASWSGVAGEVKEMTGYDSTPVDKLIIPAGHNLYNASFSLKYSDDDMTYVNIVAPWTQADSELIEKTWASSTNRFTELKIVTPVLPQIAEMFLTSEYEWERNPSRPTGDLLPRFNVERDVCAGGQPRYLIHGDPRRYRYYPQVRALSTQKANAKAMYDAWAGGKPFWLCDHEGNWIYGEILSMEMPEQASDMFPFSFEFLEVLP